MTGREGTERGECTSPPRSHVVYKTQPLSKRHGKTGSISACTLVQRRGQTGRNICFSSQYSGGETSPTDKPPPEMSFFRSFFSPHDRHCSSDFSICFSLYLSFISLYAKADFFVLVCNVVTNNLPNRQCR